MYSITLDCENMALTQISLPPFWNSAAELTSDLLKWYEALLLPDLFPSNLMPDTS